MGTSMCRSSSQAQAVAVLEACTLLLTRTSTVDSVRHTIVTSKLPLINQSHSNSSKWASQRGLWRNCWVRRNRQWVVVAKTWWSVPLTPPSTLTSSVHPLSPLKIHSYKASKSLKQVWNYPYPQRMRAQTAVVAAFKLSESSLLSNQTRRLKINRLWTLNQSIRTSSSCESSKHQVIRLKHRTQTSLR